jgi:hypothetical protein
MTQGELREGPVAQDLTDAWVDECLASTTSRHRVASRRNATSDPHQDRTRASRGSRGEQGGVVAREHEVASSRPPPDLEPPLQCSKLSVRKLAWVLGLKTEEELDAGSIGLVAEPPQDARPHGLERVLPRAPVALCLRLRSMRRAHLAVVPRGGEALQELVELTVTSGHDVKDLTSGESCELMLHAADLVEESERVEIRRDGAKSILANEIVLREHVPTISFRTPLVLGDVERRATEGA